MTDARRYAVRPWSKVKVKVTSPSNLEIWPFSTTISSAIYNGSWQLTKNSYTKAQYLNSFGQNFFIFAYFLCHVTLKLAETSIVKSRPSVPYGANLFDHNFGIRRLVFKKFSLRDFLRICLPQWHLPHVICFAALSYKIQVISLNFCSCCHN